MKNKLLILLLFPSFLLAQEQLSFSLSEAITYAKENSYVILNANDDIAIANKKVWETTTMGLPQINANTDYQNFLKQPVQLLPAQFFDNRQSILDVVEEYFEITPNGSPQALQGFIPVSFGTKHNLNASATLTQLIFNGSYLVGLQSSRVYLKISESIKEKTLVAIKEGVTNAYAGVLMTQEAVLILRKNVNILEKNLADTKEIVKNGFAEEQDTEQLQLTLFQVNNELRNMQRLKKSNLDMLKYVMGIDIEKEIVLTQTLNDIANDYSNIDLVSENFDYKNNIDYQMAENNTKANELFIKLEQSKALPSLSAFVNYGVAANNEEFRFFSKNQEWFDSSLLGVSLNVPIFSSLKRSSRVQQAKIGLQKAERDLIEVSQKLKLQHQTAFINYKNAVESYQTSKESLALSERIEKKENIKFFEGVSSSFQLSTAQNQLYTQQQSYLQAIFNLINKKAALATVLNK